MPGYEKRALAINAQKQIAGLVLAWLSFGVRLYQTVQALQTDDAPRPPLAPRGVAGMRAIIDAAVHQPRRRSELVGAFEQVFGKPNGGAATLSFATLHTQRLLWLGAHLIAFSFGSGRFMGQSVGQFVRPLPFATGEGFWFDDLESDYPQPKAGSIAARRIGDWLRVKFYNPKHNPAQREKAIDDLTEALYRLIRATKTIEDPFPYLFQRCAIWTAVLGFDDADVAPPSVYMIVREARSPSTPDWGGRHFLVRDLLYVRRWEEGRVARAFYYSANDRVIYELSEAAGHDENSYCRFDGAKVEGKVRELSPSTMALHKSLSLCLPRALLDAADNGVHDGILFAQRGGDRVPGAWAVLASRCNGPRGLELELLLRQLVSAEDALEEMSGRRMIGSFPTEGREGRRALVSFLRRTAYAQQNWSTKSLLEDRDRVAEVLRRAMSKEVLDAGRIADHLIAVQRRHIAKITARSIILRDGAGAASVDSLQRLHAALFSFDLPLTPETAS